MATIAADQLNTTAQPVKLPIPGQIDPNVLAGLQTQLNAIAKSAADLQAQQQTQQSADTGMEDIFKQYLGEQAPPPNQAEAYASALGTTTAGLTQTGNAAQQQVNDLTAKLNAITTNSQVAQQQLESGAAGKDITTQFLGKQQQEVSRQAAIQGLPIAAQLAVAQGNNALAQQHLDRLFSLQSQDAQNQYNFRQEQIKAVYEFASAKEKARLDAKATQDAQTFQTQRDNANNAQAIAKSLLATQPQLSAAISGIDWSQPDAQQKYTDLLQQAQKDPNVALDIALKQAELAYRQKQTALLGQPTPAEQKKINDAIKNAQASLPAMQDKLTTIDALKTSPGLASRVGPNIFSRDFIGIFGQPSTSFADLTGQGQAFAGGVHQLTQGLTLQNLIDAKANGATFGALSDAELQLLASSATRLSDWELKDKNGKGLGVWNIDEASFKRELDNIKTLTQRAITQSGGSLISSDEQAILNNVYSNQPVDAANYYK